MHLLILFHFILKTSEVHNIQLSNFLSFPQGKPVATPASYLKWSWEWSAVFTVSLLCSALAAYKLNLLWQMMMMLIWERPSLLGEQSGKHGSDLAKQREVAAGVPLQPCVLDMHRSAKNAHQQVRKNRDNP